jgi:hypothetical protein
MMWRGCLAEDETALRHAPWRRGPPAAVSMQVPSRTASVINESTAVVCIGRAEAQQPGQD